MGKKKGKKRPGDWRRGRGKGQAGRPVELTDELLGRVVARVGKGFFLEQAADHEGVDVSTLRALMREGSREHRRRLADAEMGYMTPARNPRLERAVRFSLAIRQARAMADEMNLDAMRRSAKWQAHAWMLERRRPELYARPTRIAAEASVRSGSAAAASPSSPAAADVGDEEQVFSLRFTVTGGPETSGESDASGA